jgi:CRP-like cAMP-binding protein
MSLVETILLTLFLAIFLYYFLTFVFSKSNDKNKQQKLNKIKKKIGLSLDDLALFDKKYKPMALNWIKTKTNATLKFLGGKAQRGDGLVSIFTDSHESATDMDSSKIRIRNVRSQILSESQAIAFDSLFTWGIFEGAEISILNELCSNSTTINRKAGEIIFAETDSPSEFLYVLQSGTVDISFQGPDGSRKVIHTIGDGGVLASVADVISWITRTDTSRGGVYAQCVTDCMLIAIPSPRDISGKYQSRLHTITFSRITRMLLIRFNRTTITTALFYLGLAQHFPPSFPKIEIPQDLIALLSASDDSFDPMSGTHHKDCIKFVREAIASLYGVLPSEVELPYQKTSTVPNPLLSAPSPLSRARSFSSCEEAAMNAADLDPYFPTSRIVPEELGVRQRTGICRMREGQSIFDVDPIPGLYIIVSGKVEIRYRIIQKGQPSPLMRDQSLQEPSSQLSYLSARETSASIVSTGEIIGHVTLLAGSSTEWYGRSDGTSSPLMSAKALTDTWLIRVPVETFDKTLASRPDAIFDLSARMMSVLPPTVRLFDFCTKWITLQGGEDIVKRGQPSTGELFIILCGRLRVLMNEHEVESEENQTWNTRTQGADWILTRGTLIGNSFATSLTLSHSLSLSLCFHFSRRHTTPHRRAIHSHLSSDSSNCSFCCSLSSS